MARDNLGDGHQGLRTAVLGQPGGIQSHYSQTRYSHAHYSQFMPGGDQGIGHQGLRAAIPGQPGGLQDYGSPAHYSHVHYSQAMPGEIGLVPAAGVTVVEGPPRHTTLMVQHRDASGNYSQMVREVLGGNSNALPGMNDFTRRRAPTLRSLHDLRPLVPTHLQDAYFAEAPGPTDWERRAQGGLELGAVCMPTTEELATYFNVHILPSAIAPDTRLDYSGMWHAWVTFCYAQGRLSSAFPAENYTLRAFLVHLLLCRYAPSTVAKYLSAVQHRCRQFGAPPPLAFREMAAWMKPLRRLIAAPAGVTSRLWPCHIQAFLSAQVDDGLQERNALMIAIGTVGAMRPSELVALDVCDWIAAFETDRHMRFLGDAAYIKRQKNDQQGVGMYKRFAYGSTPRSCIPSRIHAYMLRFGLVRHPNCEKWSGDSGMRSRPCQLCGRLFRKMIRCADGRVIVKRAVPHDLSREAVQTALLDLIRSAGALGTGYTGKALRRGGLSTAKRAGIPPALRREQSGHRSQAHKHYESSSDDDAEEEGVAPDLPTVRPQRGWQVQHLYRFSQAFGL